MTYRACLAVVMLSSFLTTRVLSHGPQLQITNDEGKIVTRNIFFDSPYTELTSRKSLYVMPLMEYNGGWYSRPNGEVDPVLGLPVYYSGPGLAYGYDQVDGGARTLLADTILSLNLTDGLKRWDGTSFVDPGSEQIQAFRGSAESPSATAITSDSGAVASLALPAIAADYDEEAHSTVRFRLLGDGTDPLSTSQDGVYLVSLNVASTQAGLASSDEFHFMLAKNAGLTEVSAAVAATGIDAAQVQFVPEPASIVLAAWAALGLAGWRRRRARPDQNT
jgi:hypothetical protein